MSYSITFNNLGHRLTERVSAPGPIEAYHTLKAKYPNARVIAARSIP